MSRGMNGKGKRLPVTRTNAAQAALEPGRSDGRFESPDESSQPAHRASATPARFDVVALVTSAGGLEAVSAVLRDLPADFPAAVVVAQHLSGQGSALAGILDRRTKLPVEWASSGTPLVPGRVVVCPPRRQLEILPDGTCAVGADISTRDKPLDLTRSEFDILQDLLSAGRRVVGKNELALMLRGESHLGLSFVSEHDTRAIEVHVANLRRKLGESASAPRWIETIRGVVYRLTL